LVIYVIIYIKNYIIIYIKLTLSNVARAISWFQVVPNSNQLTRPASCHMQAAMPLFLASSHIWDLFADIIWHTWTIGLLNWAALRTWIVRFKIVELRSSSHERTPAVRWDLPESIDNPRSPHLVADDKMMIVQAFNHCPHVSYSWHFLTLFSCIFQCA